MRVGDTIVGYDIVAKMKSGGMAALFLGRRSRAGGFEKHVAIKVVHEHLSEDKEFARMFLDEARLSASIEHPNVVHVHDLGSMDGRDFLIMEYVPGVALSQVIRALRTKSRRPTPAAACWIAMQVASGLHAAHELTNEAGQNLGVVHRDVSPKNVLVAYKGYVKLIDFGIAKAADRIHHTQGPLLKGTFRYMSPEQAGGRPLDRRTDIYALGIMLWEMLTLQRLFDAENDLLLLDLVRNPAVPPPSSVAPDLTPALDAVVLKSLAPNPDDRFATAAEFRNALAQALPEALSITQAEIADLIGVAMEGHTDEADDPSVRSALGSPKSPAPDAAARLTLDVGVALTTSGAAALAPHALPTAMTPTPHSNMSGVRSSPTTGTGPMFDVGPVQLEQAPPPQRSRKTAIAMGALLLAVGSGVGFAVLVASRQPQATPLAPLDAVVTPQIETSAGTGLANEAEDQAAATQAAAEQAAAAQAAAEQAAAEQAAAEQAAAEQAAEQAAEEQAAEELAEREAARQAARDARMRSSMMRSSMNTVPDGPVLVDEF